MFSYRVALFSNIEPHFSIEKRNGAMVYDIREMADDSVSFPL